MLTELIVAYQGRAQESFMTGGRPYLLPCEVASGEHCSTQFVKVAEVGGAVSAVTELMGRCPKGGRHAVKALGWSTLFALSPLGASSEPCGGGDPCLPGDPTAADPCSGKDPLSRDIAGCDC